MHLPIVYLRSQSREYLSHSDQYIALSLRLPLHLYVHTYYTSNDVAYDSTVCIIMHSHCYLNLLQPYTTFWYIPAVCYLTVNMSLSKQSLGTTTRLWAGGQLGSTPNLASLLHICAWCNVSGFVVLMTTCPHHLSAPLCDSMNQSILR